MQDCLQFYIDGRWVDPVGQQVFDAIDPATEAVSGRVAMGVEADVDRAVMAARQAFATYALTHREQRLQWLQRIGEGLAARRDDMAAAITAEMGCPAWLAEQAQVGLPATHIDVAIETLREFAFEQRHGATLVRKEPIGVCALITPWNWPLSLMMTKVVPALATGCTMVLKPSEYAPYSARLLAEIIDAAGVPAGVFNMVYGTGPVVGQALSVHPEVDAISITGSSRAGIEVARNAAATVKRVHQELGGKSPSLLLEGADFEAAVASCVRYMFMNSGQTCSAPSRLLVPRERRDEVLRIARATADTVEVGAPDSGAFVGPVVNAAQWARIQGLIETGIAEGATLVCGGPGRPAGLTRGYYVKPTIFADTTPEMTIVREEIFGPVLVIQTYVDLDDAVRLANDTPYGLAAYVHAGSIEQARAVGARIRAGQINLNGDLQLLDPRAPFGGRKMSGNGREWGSYGFEAFIEEVAYVGYAPDDAGAQDA